MDKSKELKSTTKVVKAILEENEMARNSDMVLYVKVCEALNPKVLKEPFWHALISLKEYNLPCIETVRRTRQKLQELHPELCGTDQVEIQRTLNEEAFRKYARGNA